jgi:hypothetical protein
MRKKILELALDLVEAFHSRYFFGNPPKKLKGRIAIEAMTKSNQDVIVVPYCFIRDSRSSILAFNPANLAGLRSTK